MRTNILIVLLLILTMVSCNKTEHDTVSRSDLLENNLLADLSGDNLGDFEWMNKPDAFTLEEGTLTVKAAKGTDFFNNPEDKSVTATAPLLFRELDGDFVAQALVQPDFSGLWNAVSMMVYLDEMNWIKFAFENSDATGPSIVTVVTKEVSDDANGVILKETEKVWLKLVRKGNIYSMLWSADGKVYKMARLTTMPAAESVKVGIETQSPVDDAVMHTIHYFGMEEVTVEDLRKGE